MKVWMRAWGDDWVVSVDEPAGGPDHFWWQQELDDDLVDEFLEAQDHYYSLVRKVDEAASPSG